MSEKYLTEIIENSEPKIKGSAIFLSLFNEGYKKEPTPLLQLALAIVLDKPIHLIVTDGTVVPLSIKKIAASI